MARDDLDPGGAATLSSAGLWICLARIGHEGRPGMMPSIRATFVGTTRQRFVALCGLALAVSGCVGGATRTPQVEQAEAAVDTTTLVGDYASAAGMHLVKVESIGLVTGLDGTGSDPGPSYERSAILADMQARGIDSPNQVLASANTSVALVLAYLRPGIQKGDRFDIEVRTPSRSETTSLRGGWLMEARLKEVAAINNQVHEGQSWALAQGPLLVDPMADGEQDQVRECKARVLGGGVALKSRSLGLVLRPEHRSVPKSSLIGTAVNSRFHTFQNGIKRGVATPLNDEYIELLVHPRYKDNLARYMQVVRAVPLRESPLERIERLQRLKQQLLDPSTAERAALRLEAIGKEALPVLHEGIVSSDPLVRFYAAEALAYLDDLEAVEPLKLAARDERAFRLLSLTALSTMSDYAAYEALQELLASPSAETRYGAFRALWSMNAKDPLVHGEMLGDQFSLHVLDVAGPPLVHLTRGYRAEVVLFGADQRLVPPLALEAGHHILIRAEEGDQITVTRFEVDTEDERRVVSSRIDEVLRAVVELGGTYPDVVQALQQAKAHRALPSRLEVDAVPEAGRTYFLGVTQAEAATSEGPVSSTPVEGSTPSGNEAGDAPGPVAEPGRDSAVSAEPDEAAKNPPGESR